uniref:Uncharacterized protein n=1 Tax=Aegilops tauschii subsp. strangulata TaxID=200361 RepID=A0A453L5L4_AEGTS
RPPARHPFVRLVLVPRPRLLRCSDEARPRRRGRESAMASLGRLKSAIFDREERKMQYQSHIRGLNAYHRHKKFMKDYVQFYGHEKNVDNSLPIKTDKDTLREGYRGSFFPRKTTWIQLGRRGWSNVTMTSFLKSIALLT